MQLEELFSVRGKTVLVTGGSRGIGEIFAAGFVANGATVYIGARKADACEEAARRLAEAYGGTCITWNVNVPNIDVGEVRGIAEAGPAPTGTRLTAQQDGDGSYRLALTPHPPLAAPADGGPPVSDRALLDRGWVSIAGVTPPTVVPVGEVELFPN